MKLSKSISCLVSSIALLGVMAGCGPRNNDSSSSASTPADSTNTGNSNGGPTNSEYGEAPKTINIDFWHTFGQSIVTRLETVAADFKQLIQEHDGITVNVNLAYKGGYDDLEKAVITGFAGGSYPNISVAYPDNVANFLYQAPTDTTVVNLDKWMNDEEVGFGKQDWLGDVYSGIPADKSDFVEAFIDESTMYQKEGSYSLPFMKSSEVMFYNKDAFERAFALYAPAGVGDTEEAMANWLAGLTWSEFIDFNRFISANKSKILSTLEYPVVYDSDSNLFITKLAQNDVTYSAIGTDGRGTVPFESGEARTKTESIVQEIVDLHNAGILNTKAIEGEYGSNSFVEQACLFSIGSSGGAGYNIPSSNEFEVGVCRVPPVDENHAMYISQGPTLTLLENSNDAKTNYWKTYYSWEFLKYITNPEVNAQICVLGSNGYVPVRDSAYTTATYQRFLSADPNNTLVKSSIVVQEDIGMAGEYITSPVFVGSANLRDAVGGIFAAVVSEGLSVNQAITDAITQSKQFFHALGDKK